MGADASQSSSRKGPGGTPWSEWVSRFGIYFLGVAIGVIIVGLIWQARAKEVQAREQQTQRQSAPDASGQSAPVGR